MSSRLHTFTWRGFDPFNTRADDVDLEDIAHALAMTCRFGGMVPRFYSVAQHAVLVALMVMEASRRPDWALLALHHDSAEAYLGDIPRPIKRGMMFVGSERHLATIQNPSGGYIQSFAEAEAVVYSAILTGLGLLDDKAAHNMIRDADNAMLAAELQGLMGVRPDEHTGISPMAMQPLPPSMCMGWEDAKAAFLALHAELSAQIGARP